MVTLWLLCGRQAVWVTMWLPCGCSVGYHVVAVWAGPEERRAAGQGEGTLHLLLSPPRAPLPDGRQLGETT